METKPRQNVANDIASMHSSFAVKVKGHSSRQENANSFGFPRPLSVTSADDDATTTTSGSYVINPEELRIETFVGADVIV